MKTKFKTLQHMVEIKKQTLWKTLEQIHSSSSSLLLFFLQWKDLEDHFDMMRRFLQEQVKELESKEKRFKELELQEKWWLGLWVTMGGWPAVFSFFPLQHMNLCGWWSGGGWFCSDLLVVWGVSGVVVGWVLPIYWWLLGCARM